MKLRARRDEDKAERAGAILNAARIVWARSSAFDFSVDEVAKLAGVVKGTVYLYFPSKERLLLFVFESYVEEFLDDVDGAMEKFRGRAPADDIAELLSKQLRGRDPFLKLLPLVATAKESSDFVRDRFARTASLIEAHAPKIDGLQFLLRNMALFAGTAALEALFRRSEDET